MATETVAVHILNEQGSLPSDMSSRMWCGATTIELFDGTFMPEMNYCFEAQSEFGTCELCRKAFAARTVRL